MANCGKIPHGRPGNQFPGWQQSNGYSQLSSTAKAVKAVNALIPFCEEDQQSLLDIITDYFDDVNEKRS